MDDINHADFYIGDQTRIDNLCHTLERNGLHNLAGLVRGLQDELLKQEDEALEEQESMQDRIYKLESRIDELEEPKLNETFTQKYFELKGRWRQKLERWLVPDGDLDRLESLFHEVFD